MKLVLLADRPDAMDRVASWYFDEWASATPGMTLDHVKTMLSSFVNRDQAPILVLAEEKGEVIGAAQFKIREMGIYPEYEFWLGGVYVEEKARGLGVGSALVRDVLARAEAAGVKRLYLQTEDLTGGLYRRHGFEPIEEVDNKGHRVLVMVANTGA